MWPRRHKLEINKKEKTITLDRWVTTISKKNYQAAALEFSWVRKLRSAYRERHHKMCVTGSLHAHASTKMLRIPALDHGKPQIWIKYRSRTNVDSQWNSVYKAFHRIFCYENEQMRQCDLDAANLNLRPALEHGYVQQTPSAGITFSRATLL